MQFRSDVQVLRGISVLLVVLYHLGFSALNSGFLGVDVFFVISGFLMAILYDHKNKVNFLTKRAARLRFYSLIAVLLTLLASFLINTPNETNQVTTQAI